MTSSIKEQLVTLAELQQADIDIAGVEKDLAGVQARMDALNDELTGIQHQVDESRARLDSLKKQYRNDEAEVRRMEDGAAKSNAKLSSVKTNKEYQSLLKEIDDFREKSSAIEDQMLAALEMIETAEQETASLLAELADAEADIASQKKEIAEGAEAQKNKLTRLVQEREAIWAGLAPKLQHTYSRAVQQGTGIGVTAVADAVCQVCRVNVPPQLFIDLMRLDSIRMCPNCQRIMYPNTIWEGK